MSSRTSRKTTKVVQETTASQSTPVSTPSTSTMRSPGRNRPPSPTVISRLQEKTELASLNDRLAVYIEKVRRLEHENRDLSKQLEVHEETVTREVTNIKSLYETELTDARKLLDETSNEKARLQIDAGRYKAEAEEWKDKYQRAHRDAQNYEKKLLTAEAQVNDLQARLNDAVGQRKHFENECNKLKADLAMLEKQLATAKKQLEEETMARVDLENKLQSLKEDLAFKNSLYEQEITEARSRTEIRRDEVDASLHAQYDAKLKEALQEMRADNEYNIRVTREETEQMFSEKLERLRQMAESKDEAADAVRNDLRLARKKIDELNSEMTRLASTNATYEARIRDLEAQLEREQIDFRDTLDRKNEEIRKLKQALEDQLAEYRDLMDVKIALDMEIDAYRRLLESEETRLNISSAAEASSMTTPASSGSRKRRRVEYEEEGLLGASSEASSSSSSAFTSSSSAKGNLAVAEVDTEGNFVKIENTGEKEMSIGGWQIRHVVGDSEEVYKFHRAIKLAGGQTVTVWSSDSGTTHSPPNDLVMKGQRWSTGDEMKTVLVNPQKVEMASRDMTRSMLRTTVTRTRLSGIEGDPQGERCTIM